MNESECKICGCVIARDETGTGICCTCQMDMAEFSYWQMVNGRN